jgi:uncharacterized protein (DUF58 family)
MRVEEILRGIVDVAYALDWETIRLSFGFHRGAKFGSGFRYEGVRPEYAWPRGRLNERATEISGEPYVSIWRTNRNVRVFVFVDLSSSMEFGEKDLKRERAALLAASVAYSVYRSRDVFTLVGFADRMLDEVLITPEDQDRDLPRKVAEAILAFPHGQRGSAGLGEAMQLLPESEPSLVFVLSDFWPPDAFIPHLAEIADIHDVVPVVFRDLWEETLPQDWGFVNLRDAETGAEVLVRLGPKERSELRKRIDEENLALLRAFGRLGIDAVWCVPGKDDRVAISEFFAARLET